MSPPVTTPRPPMRHRLWRRLSLAASLSLCGFGLGALAAAGAGRQLPAPWYLPSAAAALGLLLVSVSLVCIHADFWRGAQAAAGAAAFWSAALTAVRLGASHGTWLQRISPAMVLLTLLALAVLIAPRYRALAFTLVAGTALVGWLGVLHRLFALGGHTTPVRALSLMLSLCILLWSAAWLGTEPHLRPLALLSEFSSTGWLMRRVIPVALVFPLLLAWIQTEQAAGLPAWTASLAIILICFVVFLTLVWKAATALDNLDTSRADLKAYAHEISDLYHNAPCGYHSLDARGVLVKINDTELRWLGYRREELVDRLAFSDLLTEPSRASFERHFLTLRDQTTPHEIEIELRRKDGTTFAGVVSSTAICDPRGQFQRTRSTLFDITQRKQADAALRASEAGNRAILASAADAIISLDETGAILEFNPAAAGMFGLRRAPLAPAHLEALLAPGSVLRGVALEALAASDGDPAPSTRAEFTACRADLTTFPAELTVTRVPGGPPGRFTAFIRDLTERQRAEAELRASEERLRLLLESTGEGILALDLEGHCTLCNRAAVRILGYQREADLIGKRLHELIHHSYADGTPYPRAECKCLQAAREGSDLEVDDEVFWRADGTSVPVAYRSYPLLRNGQWMGLVVTFSDITTRRNLENQIRQSQKMEAVGRLAAGVAHDFNNLLTVINGYSEMLLGEGEPEPPELPAGAVDKLSSIRQAGLRAASLTHQLLAFSRQQVLQPRVLDLNAVVLEMEPLLRRSVGEDVDVSLRLASSLRSVRADPSQIDQILMNLVVNASDAINARGLAASAGRIRILTSNLELTPAFARLHPGLAPGPYVLLEVKDNGTGMRPETQAHIFEPFFTTKPQGRGTGLGLPTVFGIARQSGGAVVVDSEWGRGTRMQIYLPVHHPLVGAPRLDPAALRLERSPARPAPPPRRELVLVVEDEAGLRRLLLEVLRTRGYSVLEAADPHHALRLFEEHRADIRLLITDVVMPDMNGGDLADRLLARQPRLRILFITGYADRDFEGLLARPGCQLLNKPFGPEELERRVRELLDGELTPQA